MYWLESAGAVDTVSARRTRLTADWLRVFSEAAELGVLHLHLTGGEPLARPDLIEMIAGARRSRLYTNLITSGIGLSRERLAQLVDAQDSTTSNSAFRIRPKATLIGLPERALMRTR